MVQRFITDNSNMNTLILNAGAGDTRYDTVGTIFDCDIAENKLKSSLHPIHASITSIPCHSSFFDLYVCVGSVLNYCDLVMAIKEMARVLKIGGQAILEFERSQSAEFLFTSDYGRNCFRKSYEYNGCFHSIWLYSERYVDSVLEANGFSIYKKDRFHVCSSIVSRFIHNDLEAAQWVKFDKYLKAISPLAAHNCIYYIKHTKL